ncbi:MAG: ABC transporter substrate-binding protein [Bdellovibrionota bacterium]
MKNILLLVLLTMAFTANAQPIVTPDPVEQVTATASNPVAPKKLVFIYNMISEPKTLHPLKGTDIYSQRIKDLVLDYLLDKDLATNEWVPRLAEKWEVSKDGKEITFTLRADATFHDGKPVTAEDVKFSFDSIFDPKYEAIHMTPAFQGFSKVEVVNPTTVKFFAKEKYFKNFDVAANLLQIIPKHVYGDPEKSSKLTSTLVGSGPYAFERLERGKKLVLKRNTKWAPSKDEFWKGAFNFEKIDVRFYKDDNIMIEKLKAGELDYLSEDDFLAEAYHKKAVGPAWGKTIFKRKVTNLQPKGYMFVGWNLRQDLFQDRNVRIALTHLMNREEMNQKFRYGESDLATGPVYIGSEYKSPNIKALQYDPVKAQELLAGAGWKDTDADGILDKKIKGKKVDFKFSLLFPAKEAEKYWLMYQEDLKKAGIAMELKNLDWDDLVSAVDSFNFDAAAMAWGGGDIDFDLKQLWHSSSAVPGGSNFVGYKNSDVDKLIDQARLTLDKKDRIKIMQKIDEIIAADAPYVFMFNNRYFYYAHSKRIERPGDTFKYGVGSQFWWRSK